MNTLGINANLLHDSGAAVVKNSRLVAAVAEERLTRVKQQNGAPKLAVEAVLEAAQIAPEAIDRIHIVGYPPAKKLIAFGLTSFRLLRLLKFQVLPIAFSQNRFQSLISRRLAVFGNNHINLIQKSWKDTIGLGQLLQSLRVRGFRGSIHYIPHHVCHLAAAYSASGIKKRCLVVNVEGTSFGFTTNIYVGEKGKLTEVSSTPDPHSSGHFYAAITEMLGFRPGFHEGKVTGLAAYGIPNNQSQKHRCAALLKVMNKLLWLEGMQLRIAKEVFLWPYYTSTKGMLPPELAGFHREEIAWAAQTHLEAVIVKLVSLALAKTNSTNLIMTGGVAANVHMNQKLSNLPNLKQIYVYPAMGDFGNAHGAAITKIVNNNINVSAHQLKNVYLGPSYGQSSIKKALDQYNLVYAEVGQGLAKRLAKLLKAGKVIGLFQGRMEYGPRALGNRSILARATDKLINQKLNQKLRRTEFMPFAPVVLYEKRNLCFTNTRGAEFTAEFMTITFDCTDWMQKNCPAVVHLDGTARPQLIKSSVNLFYYDILKEYYTMTGIPVLVNTSFNMHEEPIVNTPQDAIRSFLAAKLDYLVLDNYLVHR